MPLAIAKTGKMLVAHRAEEVVVGQSDRSR